MGWCWRRCLSEEDEDEDDIGHYPLCWGCFFCYSFGRAFFALVAVGMVAMVMNGKHICPHEMVFFSFSSYINLVQRTDFFSFLSHPRSYTCKDSYVGFVVVAVGGRGPCRGLGSSV